MKKKRILVLGSNGQIGDYLCKYLTKKKYKVKKIDLTINTNHDLRIKNNKLLIKNVKLSDYIFFLAFDVGGSRYLKKYQNKYEFLDNNLKIMINTFDILAKFKKKFLFASSQMSNMTYSNYGLLKLVGERVTKSLNCNYVKFWNVYGIENDLKKAHVITDFARMAIKNKKISMITNGNETREFLHVLDCCKGLELIMKKHDIFKKNNRDLHLSTGKKIKIFSIAKIIQKIAIQKNFLVKIAKGKSVDNVQFNKKNKFNKFLFKYWRPKIEIETGVKEIFNHSFQLLK